MARSAALNPASMPFFPGGFRVGDDERGTNGVNFAQNIFREQDRSSVSLHSTSSTDFRSVKSSPSPPQSRIQDPRHQPSPGPRDIQRQSPPFRQADAGKSYPNIESRSVRDGSGLGALSTLTEREDTQSPEQEEEDLVTGSGHHTPGSSFYSAQQQSSLERLPAIPFSVGSLTGSVSGVPFTSSSPVSSLDSNSRATSAVDLQTQNFEAQLKASPLIHDILDRLVRCEYTTREIQRDLGDINRKVNILVERALGVNNQPEFKDPFASNASSVALNKPRPSIGNIAPNQAANTDDITSISQRLNTLTSSVGQLLALQTQQMQQTAITDGRNNSVISLSSPQLELAPNQTIPSGSVSNATLLGHGLPNRPDLRPAPRQPNPPMRTWSAGNLDLPVRSNDPGMNRPDSMLRDKRRSVSGLLRRDSSGVSVVITF